MITFTKDEADWLWEKIFQCFLETDSADSRSIQIARMVIMSLVKEELQKGSDE